MIGLVIASRSLWWQRSTDVCYTVPKKLCRHVSESFRWAGKVSCLLVHRKIWLINGHKRLHAGC